MMKNLKIKFLSLLALCLAVSACNNDSKEVIVDEATPVAFNISAAYPVKVAEGENYPQTAWKAGDQLAVLRTNKRTFDKIVMSYASNGEFTGTIDSNTDEDAKYAFLYPADAYEPNTNDTLVQVLPLNGQDGTLAGVANYDYAWGEGPIVTSTSSYSVEADMSSLVSICKFQFLTENGAPMERISQVILTAPQGSLYQCATLDMKKGTLDDFVKGSIKVENKNGLNGEVYVALFPSKTSLHFTISTIDGKAYEASISEDAFIPQGGFVVFEPVVCTSLPLAKVGDHYYTDATWSTELNPNKKCVGVVYALENEAGKMVNTLASSSHGRVVALKDVVQKATWALSSEDVAELANQETLCDTLTIGCLPYFDGTVNSYFDDDKAHQLGGVRVDEANGLIANWYSNGALNDFEGEQNTSYIDHNISQYPAGTYPTRFSEGITGWYLPSLGDLALLWSLHKTGIVRADKQECFKDFAEFGYWSSSEASETEAWYVNFYSGMVVKNSKQSGYNVRTVIRF
jgi:hypothetical protein